MPADDDAAAGTTRRTSLGAIGFVSLLDWLREHLRWRDDEPEPDEPDDEPEPDPEPEERVFYVEGAGAFRVEVDGSVAPHEDVAQWAREGEQYGDDWVGFRLGDSWTKWLLTGEITALGVSDGQHVDLDGKAIDPADHPDPDGFEPTEPDEPDDEPEPEPEPDEFETVVLEAGETWRHDLSDGETFENVLFDCRADNCNVQLNALGVSNWTIRNVGVLGRQDKGMNNNVAIEDPDPNGESVIENVYLGDGSGPSAGTYGATGFYMPPSHAGHLDIRNVYIEGYTSNAFYLSPPAYTGAEGSVHLEGCFSKNNDISLYRLGGGMSMRDCVAVNDTDVDYAARHGRGLWAWAGTNEKDVHVDGCDLATNGHSHGVIAGANNDRTGVRVHLADTSYHPPTRENNGGRLVDDGGNDQNPAVRVPDGCPQSAEEAAGGR